MSLPTCPKCGCQLEVKLIVASGPKSSQPPQAQGDLEELLSQIDDDTLTGQAAVFVASTRERFEQYGSKTMMSEKQMNWLRQIAAGENK